MTVLFRSMTILPMWITKTKLHISATGVTCFEVRGNAQPSLQQHEIVTAAYLTTAAVKSEFILPLHPRLWLGIQMTITVANKCLSCKQLFKNKTSICIFRGKHTSSI